MSHPAETSYLGLAPFLRLSIGGEDLQPIAQALLQIADQDQHNPYIWMNLATAFFCIGQREHGLAIQAEALSMERFYQITTANQPAKCRLLVLSVAGDISENTPIDCLLEGSDIDLLYYYATADAPLPASIPEHDAVLVAICDAEANWPVLQALAPLIAAWHKPVINKPQFIHNTERNTASTLLQNIPGLLMPPTRHIERAALYAIVRGDAGIDEVFAGCNFPIIVRPVGSHAGRDLARIDDIQGIADYLLQVDETDFYLSRFIDYSGHDGQFRKFRIALINGQAFACHMGISSHWMIHYLNAGMYENAEKRQEESRFMEQFADFAKRHAGALTAIHQRSKLDYVCIDCAETQDGALLIFEIDHAMVVHAMDPSDLFPYKQVHMNKVRRAFESFLMSLLTRQPTLAENET